VTAWFKAGRALKEDEYAARAATFEETAKEVVGDLLPTTVLDHWVEIEVATLLSNPQLQKGGGRDAGGKGEGELSTAAPL